MGTNSVPEIALVRRIFDVVANGFEHSAGRGYRATVEQLS